MKTVYLLLFFTIISIKNSIYSQGCTSDVSLILTNIEGGFFPNQKVELISENDGKVYTQTSLENGEVAFRVPCQQKFIIQIENYSRTDQIISSAIQGKKVTRKVTYPKDMKENVEVFTMSKHDKFWMEKIVNKLPDTTIVDNSEMEIPSSNKMEYYSTIQITFYDFDKKPIPNEEITVVGLHRNKSFKATSDSDGKVLLYLPKGDDYSMNFTYHKEYYRQNIHFSKGTVNGKINISYVGTEEYLRLKSEEEKRIAAEEKRLREEEKRFRKMCKDSNITAEEGHRRELLAAAGLELEPLLNKAKNVAKIAELIVGRAIAVTAGTAIIVAGASVIGAVAVAAAAGVVVYFIGDAVNNVVGDIIYRIKHPKPDLPSIIVSDSIQKSDTLITVYPQFLPDTLVIPDTLITCIPTSVLDTLWVPDTLISSVPTPSLDSGLVPDTSFGVYPTPSSGVVSGPSISYLFFPSSVNSWSPDTVIRLNPFYTYGTGVPVTTINYRSVITSGTSRNPLVTYRSIPVSTGGSPISETLDIPVPVEEVPVNPKPSPTKPPIGTVDAVLNRNNWEEKLIICDLTASMTPYAGQLLSWYSMYNKYEQNLQFVFFNDGNNMPDKQKKIGSTGGVYYFTAQSVRSLVENMSKVTSSGSGGDLAENNIEAMFTGIGAAQPFKELVMIADNNSPVKDMKLLRDFNTPVHVIVSGSTYFIHPHYLQIAWRTKGTIHTQEEDITEIGQMEEGDVIEIGGSTYRLMTGEFIRIKRGDVVSTR